MKLTYETGVATMIQFVVLAFLNIASQANSVVTTCRHDGGNCVSNLIVSLLFYLLIAGWFGAVWLLGLLAQNRRSKRLAQLLILAELAIMGIAYANTKLHGDILSRITSLCAIALALWVITLAFRLMRAKGGRVVSHRRTRQRRHGI